MKPDVTNFLKKMYQLTGGEFRVIIRYDVREALGLSPEQTDYIVDKLNEAGMIRQIEPKNILLSHQASSIL